MGIGRVFVGHGLCAWTGFAPDDVLPASTGEGGAVAAPMDRASQVFTPSDPV
jgi:hypothetical protein